MKRFIKLFFFQVPANEMDQDDIDQFRIIGALHGAIFSVTLLLIYNLLRK